MTMTYVCKYDVDGNADGGDDDVRWQHAFTLQSDTLLTPVSDCSIQSLMMMTVMSLM